MTNDGVMVYKNNAMVDLIDVDQNDEDKEETKQRGICDGAIRRREVRYLRWHCTILSPLPLWCRFAFAFAALMKNATYDITY